MIVDDVSTAMTLLDLFESQVKSSPTATAVTVETGKSYSYKDVDLIALNLGTELAYAISVSPVDEGRDETPLVAVMMNRGVALVAAILGILKAGAGNLLSFIDNSILISSMTITISSVQLINCLLHSICSSGPIISTRQTNPRICAVEMPGLDN